MESIARIQTCISLKPDKNIQNFHEASVETSRIIIIIIIIIIIMKLLKLGTLLF